MAIIADRDTLFAALQRVGLIPSDQAITKVVIEMEVDEPVRVHWTAYGDERLLEVKWADVVCEVESE